MKGNQTVDNNHANQLSGIAEYSLSKNTSVYAMALYQIANKGAQAQLSGQNTHRRRLEQQRSDGRTYRYSSSFLNVPAT
jgi:predicted porin